MISSSSSRVSNLFPTEGNLISEMLQLFAAGSDTTSTTLRWAVLLMAQNPDVQVKIHQEIDTVVGEKSYELPVSLLLPY